MSQKTLIGLLALALLTCLLPDPAGAQSLGSGFKLKYQEMRRDGSNAASTVAFPGVLRLATGTVSNPSIHFDTDTDTGIHQLVNGYLEIVTDGVRRLAVGGTTFGFSALNWTGNVAFSNDLTVAGNASVTGNLSVGKLMVASAGTGINIYNSLAGIVGGAALNLSAAGAVGMNAISGQNISFTCGGSQVARFNTSFAWFPFRCSIGTSTDSALYNLHVVGNALINSAATSSTPLIDFAKQGVVQATVGLTATGAFQVTVGGGSPAISVASDTKAVEFLGTASAVKVLGNPIGSGDSTKGKCGLDVWATDSMFGADSGANSRTNATNKFARFVSPHYANTSAFGFLVAQATSGANTMLVGTGGSGYTAATTVQFFTAATSGTLTGVERGRVDSSGLWGLGSATPDTGYTLTVGSTVATGGIIAAGNISGNDIVDRSASPDSLADAYEIVRSHESKAGKLDHAKLSPKAWGTRAVSRKTGRKIARTVTEEQPLPPEEIPAAVEGEPEPRTTRTVTREVEEDEIETVSEPDQSGRNLSMVVSAQALVIADLTRRLEALEKH